MSHNDARKTDARKMLWTGQEKTAVIIETDVDENGHALTKLQNIKTFVRPGDQNLKLAETVRIKIVDVGPSHAEAIAIPPDAADSVEESSEQDEGQRSTKTEQRDAAAQNHVSDEPAADTDGETADSSNDESDRSWYRVTVIAGWLVNGADSVDDAINIAVSEAGKAADMVNSSDHRGRMLISDVCPEEDVLLVVDRALVTLELRGRFRAESEEHSKQIACRLLGRQMEDVPLKATQARFLHESAM